MTIVRPPQHARTVPRIGANRNRAGFQLSFAQEFSGFFPSVRRQGISFNASMRLHLERSLAKTNRLASDTTRALTKRGFDDSNISPLWHLGSSSWFALRVS